MFVLLLKWMLLIIAPATTSNEWMSGREESTNLLASPHRSVSVDQTDETLAVDVDESDPPFGHWTALVDRHFDHVHLNGV